MKDSDSDASLWAALSHAFYGKNNHEQLPEWQALLATLLNQTGAVAGELVLPIPGKHYQSGKQQGVDVYRLQLLCLDTHGIGVSLEFSDHNAFELADRELPGKQGILLAMLKPGLLQEQQLFSQQLISDSCELLKTAWIRLDTQGRVQQANQQYQQLLDSGYLSQMTGKLLCSGDPTWLGRGIRTLRESNEARSDVSCCIQFEDIQGNCLLSRSAACASEYILLIQVYQQRPDPYLLKELYGLSQSEAEVASWFCAGMKGEHVASETGYRVNTVYSYLKKLYSQTGMKKQSQLAAEIWAMVP